MSFCLFVQVTHYRTGEVLMIGHMVLCLFGENVKGDVHVDLVITTLNNFLGFFFFCSEGLRWLLK